MKRVLVTGGGSGLGRGIARHFSAAGMQVTIAGRRADALAQTNHDHTMTCVQADITCEADVTALCATPFDIVVANAGMGTPSLLVDTPLELWEQTLSVNLTGVFLTFRESLKRMAEGGRLIAIASTAGLKGGSNISTYAASKHSVVGLVRSVAHEVAGQNITCNAVCPGFVSTDMADAAVAGVASRLNLSTEQATARVTSGNPLKRMIDIDEVVAAVAFLASPEASMINGHTLSVSGGEI
ncbi:MAG: SDR family NAD(P)-dependent oxidoreductase [Paracoccaceae bacterium]